MKRKKCVLGGEAGMKYNQVKGDQGEKLLFVFLRR